MSFSRIQLCSVLVMLSTYCQAAVITGKIDNANAPVKLFRYVDHITDSLVLIEETTSDEKGAFHISIPAGDAEQHKIVAGDVVAKFFITASSNISLTQNDTQLLVDDGAEGINRRLNSIIVSYKAWVKRNEDPDRSPEEAIDELRMIETRFRDKKDSRWNRMLHYWLARDEMFYITMKWIKVDEQRAMRAFSELEQRMLLALALDDPYYIRLFDYYIESRINKTQFRRTKGGMSPFSKVLGESSFLPTDSLKELGTVLGIKLLYERKWYGRTNNISELDDSVQNLIPKMKIPYFRQALVRISDVNNKLKRGDSFPVITLDDATRKRADISAINSDYTLVGFWATWCGPCRQSMKHYDSLQKQFGNKLSIVSISADEKFDTMLSFLRTNNYLGKWVALHNGKEGRYLDALKIDSYPTYFLLDKNKRVITSVKWDELRDVLNNIIK